MHASLALTVSGRKTLLVWSIYENPCTGERDRRGIRTCFRKPNNREIYTAVLDMGTVSRRAVRRSYVVKPHEHHDAVGHPRGNSRRDSLRNLWKAPGKLSLRAFRKMVFGSRERIHTCIKCKFEPAKHAPLARPVFFSCNRHKSRPAL